MGALIDSMKHFEMLRLSLGDNVMFKPEHTAQAVVLKYGQEFKGAPRPDWLARGTPKECFKNALLLSLETNLIYVEGFMFRFIPIMHAWCIDDDGTVIDPTIDDPQDCEYIGIPLNPEFILSVVDESGMYGILDNPGSSKIYTAAPEEFIHTEHQ